MDNSTNHSETEDSIYSEACFDHLEGSARPTPLLNKDDQQDEDASRTTETTTLTKKDLAKIKQELAESLEHETSLIERQVELHVECRDLKIAVEKAEAEKQLAALNAQREKILAVKEASTS